MSLHYRTPEICFSFSRKQGPVAHLLLVGDTGQHQAVEAGAPFEQFVRAGMQTATLDEIVRQKTELEDPSRTTLEKRNSGSR